MVGTKKLNRPSTLPSQIRPLKKNSHNPRPIPFYKRFSPGIEIKIFFIVGILVVITLINILFKQELVNFLNTAPIISSIYLPIKTEILNRTLLGQFYVASIGTLFFVTVPVELSFFVFLGKGHFPLLLLLIIVIGATVGHFINYAVGNAVGRRVLKIVVDRKQQITYTKNIKRLGMVLIFIFNVLPL
ncbi:hypothetical protein COT47_03760, partial [Candidatus Woesearchaeota archaeon CG08_land_8_20_14_0_20_43_7]